MDHTYKNGDYVQMDFYSHEEPLCSVEGQVNGEYLNVTGGSVPLDVNQAFTTNIVSRPDLKESVNPDPGQMEMTNKEIIEQLEWIKKRISNITYSPESFEALNLAEKAVSALENRASVDTFINEFKERLKRYGQSHGNNRILEDVFQILNATKQSYEKGDLSSKLQHNPCNDMADIMADPELYKHWMETSGRYL